jgi:hypothetical protein
MEDEEEQCEPACERHLSDDVDDVEILTMAV